MAKNNLNSLNRTNSQENIGNSRRSDRERDRERDRDWERDRDRDRDR